MIIYVAGTAEALEAEYGVLVDGPFAVLQFFDDELDQWFPCADMAEARQIAADDGCTVSTL